MEKNSSYADKFPALRYRDFRLLWLGLFISQTGSQMQFAAVNWHIFLLTHSPVALGLVGLMRFIPITIFSLLGGSVADAHNRKNILLITQVILGLLSFALAITTLTHTVSSFIIYVITALSAAMFAFDMPPKQAIIPSLVKREHLGNAMGLNVTMRQVATMVGPMLAGFIIAKFGVGGTYLFDAFSFVAVIVALLLMKTSGEIKGEGTKISLHSVIEGLAFVKSRALIWSTMLLDFFSTFFASATALLPIFATSILHVGPVGFGILYAAEAVGATIGGLVMTHLHLRSHNGKLLLMSVGIYGLATILFGFSTFFALSFLALLLVGVGDSVSTVIRNTIRQLATPDAIRGRMTSVNMIFFIGGPQLGEFEAGVLAAWVGAPLSVAIGGAGVILVVGIIAATIPMLRNYKGDK